MIRLSKCGYSQYLFTTVSSQVSPQKQHSPEQSIESLTHVHDTKKPFAAAEYFQKQLQTSLFTKIKHKKKATFKW